MSASQHVLVVDDSQDIHDLVDARLRAEGVVIDHALDATVGWERARLSRPDLVLLDVDLPGMTGLEWCRKLKADAALASTPVIFLTGAVDVAMKVAAFEAGATDYVTKPFDAVELRARVRAALRAKGLEDDLESRRRELQAALTERQAILDHLVDGLIAVDSRGAVRVVNPALVGLLGIDATAIGRSADEALPDGLATAIRDAATLGTTIVGELALAGGRTARVVASPVPSEEAHPGVVALVRDVTLEREIDRMKSDFIATVSHELRTPLTSILGFVKLTTGRLEDIVFPALPDGGEAEPRRRRAVAQVRQNLGIVASEGDRLMQLINDLLDVSKLDAGAIEWRMTAIAPSLLVSRALGAVGSLFPDGGPRLVGDVASGLPDVRGDFDRLLQVLINLLSNAAKFTRSGRVVLAVAPSVGGVEFSVTDTGEGIDSALHDVVFEKFRQVGDPLTSRPRGTGLGLPICRQIVRAHGGEVLLSSALGEGARFSFVLAVA